MREKCTHRESPPSVSVPVLVPVKNSRIADGPEPDLDARAAAMVATPLGRDAADKWKQFTPKPENLGQIRFADYQSTPDDVGIVPPEPSWLRERPDDPPPSDWCVHGDAPLAPGSKTHCAKHQAEADQIVMPWERPAAVAGAEE